MKKTLLLIASLLTFFTIPLFAQNPINSHLTDFQYKYKDSVEGSGVSFSKEITDIILKKKKQLLEISYQNYIDVYSLKLKNDTLYYHTYGSYIDYLGKNKKGKDVFEYRISTFFPCKAPYDSLLCWRKKEEDKHIDKILTIYEQQKKTKAKPKK